MGSARRLVVGAPSVPRLWPGETVVCIGGGPSLTQADVDCVREKARVIAVNDAYRMAPWADVLYAFDWQWWQHHEGVPDFRGLKYSIREDIELRPEWGVTQLTLGDEYGLSDDPRVLTHGKNSGYQAVNLAVHLGGSRIVLLGYDMQKSTDGRRHWFGEHPKALTSAVACGASMPFEYWRTCFQSLVKPLAQRGIEVVNCSRRTALTCFPQATLEESLAVYV